MAITAISGPQIVFGQNPVSAEYNPDIGSSLFYAGAGVLDPRAAFTYLPGESQSEQDFGWLGFDNISTLTAVPYTSANGAIVASANPTSATLTLVSANSATTGVYITSNFTRSDTGALDTNGGAGLVAFDAYASVTAAATNGVLTVTVNGGMPIGPGMVLLSASTTVTGGTLGATNGVYVTSQITTTGTSSSTGNGYTGTYQLSQNVTFTSGTVTLAYPNVQSCAVPTNLQTPSIWLWSPMALLGRVVSVFAATGATYTTATVSGYDIYGYPMVEQITLTPNSSVAGKKAFKYIKSVVLSGGTADTTHAYRVDTTSVIGLPLRADTSAELAVNAAASQVALNENTSYAANGFLPADRTTPSATTGDVRGTIDLANASGINLAPSTATNKYVVKQSPQAYNIQSATGLFGLTQYSNF
jgi:hypothetical protein